MNKSREISVGLATGYGLDSLGSISGRGKIVVYSPASRLALGSTQRPIQWVSGLFPLW
jgi:hypothetical protein